LWKPLLHEVAAGTVKPSEHEVDYSAHALRHNYRYCPGTLVGLDRVRRLIKLTAPANLNGPEIVPADDATADNVPVIYVPYDTLVIAIGSVSNDFGTPGATEHAIALETPAHAVRFHRRLVDACSRANSQDGPIKPGQLHVAIVGAGATGTELAAGLHRAARALVANGLRRVDPKRDIRIVLIGAAPRILPLFPEQTANVVRSLLEKQGIEVYTNRRVVELRADGVRLADGEFIASELVVWAAGVKGAAVLAQLGGLETTTRRQLVVNADLSTSRDPDIFALGDCAAAPCRETGGFVPPRAQAAHQMASHLAKQMERRLDRLRLLPFRYRDYGALVSLGRHTTVGNLKGASSERSVFIKGQVARLMYKALYKMHELSLHGAGEVVFKTLARSL
jgi:NADH dehydrogenase